MHHSEARAWFNQKGVDRFRTCPLTQTGVVRISSNPQFTSEAVTPTDALHLLRRICVLPGHEFWPDDVSLPEAPSVIAGLFGHRPVTDAYLVALAASHEGILATLDRGVVAVATGRSTGCVEFIV